MKKIVTTAAVIIGCVVGAGFASGREMLVFFQDANPYLVSLSFFILFFSVTYLFLHNSKNLQPKGLVDLNRQIFGKTSRVFDAVFLTNYFLAISTMIAGCQTVFQKVTGLAFPFGAVIALLCGTLVWFGLNGIKKINLLLVPVIILSLVFVAASSVDDTAFTAVDFSFVFQSAKYVAYNAMLMCGLLTACGKNLNKKQITLSSLVASLILAAMIFLILTCFNGKSFVGVEMPLLFLAKRGSFYYFFAVIVGCGIVTSLMAAAFPLVEWGEKTFKDRSVAVVVIFVLAYVVSLLGFSSILDYTLPVTSFAALIFVICSAVSAVKRRAKNR